MNPRQISKVLSDSEIVKKEVGRLKTLDPKILSQITFELESYLIDQDFLEMSDDEIDDLFGLDSDDQEIDEENEE